MEKAEERESMEGMFQQFSPYVAAVLGTVYCD